MDQERTNKITNYVIIAAFFLMTCLPLIDNVFLIDTTTSSDNRSLRSAPTIPPRIKDLPSFFNAFDLYYRDQFGFRNSLIRGYNLLYYRIFAQSGNKRIVVGKKGWLYLTEENSIEDYRKTIKLSEHALKAWTYVLEKRQQWCREKNIDYLFVFAPSKHSIYPENMPDWIRPTGEKSAFDQLLAYLNENSSVNILDLRPALIAAKRNKSFYYSGDSHWNSDGAYVAYREIMNRLSEKTPSLTPYNKTDFEIVKEGSKTQDLALILNLNPYYRRLSYKFQLKGRGEVMKISENIKQSRYSKNINEEQRAVATVSADGKANAVFFRDSFLNALTPYMAVHFNRAVYYWQPEFDPRVVDYEKPQVVVHEVAERFIDRDTPSIERRYDWAHKNMLRSIN